MKTITNIRTIVSFLEEDAFFLDDFLGRSLLFASCDSALPVEGGVSGELSDESIGSVLEAAAEVYVAGWVWRGILERGGGWAGG